MANRQKIGRNASCLAGTSTFTVLSSPTKDGQLYDAVADQMWPQGYQALSSRGESYERRGVHERNRLFGMAIWLLQDWPDRFEMCVRHSGARRWGFLAHHPNLPPWFKAQCGKD
ncbi:hypothetical protein GNX71_28465 [Variovorax sp. RKNM96]|uniref:hypothetical protein n=1 Tax=Variovorax sp. RKNM96 TaxID=2681552 RepID=UPI00197D41CB|nr:hypothetical protein [Variovorax sp. RKNM96]QSI33289.1 hypothetical protein GNX71_28465 [Variovorax sp. RKNM96]